MDRIDSLEKRVESLEKIVHSLQKSFSVKSEVSKTNGLENLLAKHILKLKSQDLVILLLHLKNQMTKDELKLEFRSLGATSKMINWFNGGNFKQRLLDQGFLFENGEKDGKKPFR